MRLDGTRRQAGGVKITVTRMAYGQQRGFGKLALVQAIASTYISTFFVEGKQIEYECEHSRIGRI